MTKHWYECLLGLLTGRRRAAEITGDLLEEHTAGLHFWWAATRVLLALTWRPVVGMFGALMAAVVSGIPFVVAWQHAGAPMPHTTWQWLAMRTLPYNAFAWASACLALFRFGIRNRTAAIAFILAALVTLECCAFGTPPVQGTAMAVFALVIFLMLRTPKDRTAIGSLARCAFSVGLIMTAWNHGYAMLLRWGKLPAGPGLPIAFSSMLLASLAGWLAMDTPWTREPALDDAEAKLSPTQF